MPTSTRSTRCACAAMPSNVIAIISATLLIMVTSALSLLIGPTTTAAAAAARHRTILNRDIMIPDPVPQSGIDEAISLMQSGRMYRYNAKDASSSVVSLCEHEIAQYTGHKYCVALNSCGSAIMLMMKCAGLLPGDEVLCNAFTFGAVPSAIEHAGGKAVYVESDSNLVMDITDLEKKLVEYPNCKYCLISHMRGKLTDMDAVKDACDRHSVTLLEDCAHSLGVYWNGQHSGHIGKVAAFSSQSYKMINSGEGGFLVTDDASIAANCAVYAGAYEGLSAKHLTVPGPEIFMDLPTQIPNYSLRMSELAAAVIRPQILTIDERREKYNARYDYITDQLVRRVGQYLSIPVDTPGTIPVHDSLQFNLSHELNHEQVQQFLEECAIHGLKVDLFGAKSNARNFVNWKFAPAGDDPLPMTTEMLKRACDVRLPLMWDDEDFDDLVNVLCESLDAVVYNTGFE
ncbi:hypothetical protein ACHAWU_002061 [Discostella pseudostelligera]|uniref:Aminotransferase n=1 Tax=Discostella pseudostelligera TaxID=259834 RepID=A0ABD3M5D3_9STRA